MRTYFRLGSRLELAWLRDRIFDLPRPNRWQALARAALRDDLYRLHRALTREVLDRAATAARRRGDRGLGRSAARSRVHRALSMLADIRHHGPTTRRRFRWRSGSCGT